MTDTWLASAEEVLLAVTVTKILFSLCPRNGVIKATYFVFQGEKSFFLRPGEQLESGIQNLFVLGEDEGLILRANEEFAQDDKVSLFTYQLISIIHLIY